MPFVLLIACIALTVSYYLCQKRLNTKAPLPSERASTIFARDVFGACAIMVDLCALILITVSIVAAYM